MDNLITFIAKYFILIPVLVTVYLLFKLKGGKRYEMATMLVVGGLLSLILAKIGSHLYYHPRPYISDGSTPLFAHSGDPNGFPSDHTLLASFLGFVALYYSKKIGIGLLVIAALIGWSRVAAHVHHVQDIIGSFVITGIVYLIVKNLVRNKTIAAKLGTTTKDSKD